MKICIIGGAGVVGQKLAAALLAKGTLNGATITELTLADIVAPAPLGTARAISCDITDPASVAAAIPEGTDVIYLLAAVVSAHAEAEFDTGMSINLHGTLNVLERARALGSCPKLVFASSMAVYGGETPDPVGDLSFLNPQSSYGTQKGIGEMLVTDYSRKGFIDGRAFRLPTISVRPGAPNRAASSFMSSIIREPLNGIQANCPVDDAFEHYYLSPKRCAENLVHGAEVEAAAFGMNRAMQFPGLRLSIGEMIAAMTEVAGPEPAKLITRNEDPEIMKIVSGWRFDLNADRALALGFKADDSFADNVRNYIADDLPNA